MAGTERLSLSRIGAVSTNACDDRGGGGAVTIHHGRRGDAVALVHHASDDTPAAAPKTMNATRPPIDFVAIPRQRPRLHVRADERREAIAGGENRPGRSHDVEP